MASMAVEYVCGAELEFNLKCATSLDMRLIFWHDSFPNFFGVTIANYNNDAHLHCQRGNMGKYIMATSSPKRLDHPQSHCGALRGGSPQMVFFRRRQQLRASNAW